MKELEIYTKTGCDYSLVLGELEEPLPTLSTEKGKKWFTKFIGIMSTNYKLNFTDVKSLNYQNLKLIYQIACEKNYGLDEFRTLIKNFIITNPYDNFTVANFFSTKRLCLHTESWKKSEISKDPNAIANMEAFLVGSDKYQTTMYRYYDISNPIIVNPNIRILSKYWDVGGHYEHQYSKIEPSDENLEQYRIQTKELKQRLFDAIEQNDKLLKEIELLKSQLVIDTKQEPF